MNNARELTREKLAAIPSKGTEGAVRRTAQSIAREAYHSSRIEGCRVDYATLLDAAEQQKAAAGE